MRGGLFDFLELSSLGVYDESSDGDVGWDEGVGFDGLYGLPDGLRRVLESFEPLVEVDAALADGVEGVVGDAAADHLMVEMVIAHVAGAAVAVCHDHDLLNSQLVDGDDEAAHGGVEGGDDESSCVLDDFSVSVLQSEGGRQQFRKPCVHAREDGELLVRVFVGKEFLVGFLSHKLLVEFNYLVNHDFQGFMLWFKSMSKKEYSKKFVRLFHDFLFVMA